MNGVAKLHALIEGAVDYAIKRHPDNGTMRTEVFIASLSGAIGIGNMPLADKIFSVLQTPANTTTQTTEPTA